MRLFLVFFIALSTLDALKVYPDFSECYTKYKKYDGIIPLSKSYAVTFQKPMKYIKYDPFLKLYLIKSPFTYPIKLKEKVVLGTWLASIAPESIYISNYAKPAYGLKPAYLALKSEKGSIVSDLFCEVVGIGAGEGRFIDTKQLRRFVQLDAYGDLKFKTDKHLRITYIDPENHSEIKVGDVILLLNGKKVHASTFEEEILSLKPSITVELTVLRDKKKRKVTVAVYKKEDDLKLFKTLGITLDETLMITEVKPGSYADKNYINKGSRIIRINDYEVKTMEEIMKKVSGLKEMRFLIKQNGVHYNLYYKKESK